MDLTKEFGPPIVRDSWKTGDWAPRPIPPPVSTPSESSASYLVPRFSLPSLLSPRDSQISSSNSDDSYSSGDEQLGYDSDYLISNSSDKDAYIGKPTLFDPSGDVAGLVHPAKRFHGESTGYRLVKVARSWKKELVEGQLKQEGAEEDAIRSVPSINREELGDEEYTITDAGVLMRSRFWKMGPVRIHIAFESCITDQVFTHSGSFPRTTVLPPKSRAFPKRSTLLPIWLATSSSSTS